MKILIDKKASLELYRNNISVIKKHECYNNTFNVMSKDDNVLFKILNEEWKIAFCYVRSRDKERVHARHACFYNHSSYTMIDVTAPTWNDFSSQTNIEYKIIKLLNHSEYIDAIDEDRDFNPALWDYLHDETNCTRMNLINQGYIPID